MPSCWLPMMLPLLLVLLLLLPPPTLLLPLMVPAMVVVISTTMVEKLDEEGRTTGGNEGAEREYARKIEARRIDRAAQGKANGERGGGDRCNRCLAAV